MGITPSKYFDMPADADIRVAKPVSSTRIASKVMGGANHLLGHIVGGMRHAQVQGSQPAVWDGYTGRIYTYRHPNVDWLDCFFRIWKVKDETPPVTTPWSIAVTAGSGTTVTYGPSDETDVNGKLIFLRVPWGETSGYAEVTFVVTNCYIRGTWFMDCPRSGGEFGLDTGDSFLREVEQTNGGGRIGLTNERYISASTSTSGPKAMIGRIYDAWDYCRPQLMSWWDPTGLSISSAFPTYTSFFSNSLGFNGRNRMQKGESVRASTWYLYTWSDVGVTAYRVLVQSDNDVAAELRAGSSATWGNALSLDVDVQPYDTLNIKGTVVSGSGNVYLGSCNGIGDGA